MQNHVIWWEHALGPGWGVFQNPSVRDADSQTADAYQFRPGVLDILRVQFALGPQILLQIVSWMYVSPNYDKRWVRWAMDAAEEAKSVVIWST